jgi:hypothetical protein
VIRDGQLSVNLSNPCALMDQYHVWPDWKFAHLHKEVGLHLRARLVQLHERLHEQLHNFKSSIAK